MAQTKGIVKDNVIVLETDLKLEEGTEVLVLYPTEHPLSHLAGSITNEEADAMLEAIYSSRKSKKEPPDFG